MLSRYKEVAETILSLHESRDRVVRRAVVELVPRLAAFSPRRFCESYLARSAAILLASIRGPPSERDAGFDAVGDLALALAEDDDDSDDDETETLRSHDAAPSRESSRGGGGGGQSGQSGFGFAASAASSVSRRSSDGGNLSLADSAASGHAGQGSSQGAQGHHQGAQGSQQGQQNARPRRSGSLAEKTWSGPSQTNLNLARAVAADRRAANHRRLGVAALERYLPEIASAIRETCVASAKASQGSGGGSYYGGGAYGGGVPGFNLNLGGGGARGGDGKNRTAAGRSGGSSFLEPGAAEALLCVGALASSCGELWEPHARALLPALFAPGLTAPLVDALDAVAVALPATLPMIQRRLIDTISGILAPIHHARAGGGGQGGIGPGAGATRRGGFYSYASGGGGGAFGPSSPSRGGGGGLGAGGLGAASTRVSDGDHYRGAPPKSPTRSTIEDSVRAGGAMLQRVVSGIFDPSGSGGGAAGSSASGSFRDLAPSGAASGDSSRGAKIPLPHRVQRVSSADDLPDAAGAFGSFGTPPGTPLRGRDFYGAQGDSAGNPSNASALGAGSPGRAAGYGPGAHPGGGYPPGPAGAFHGADAYGSARGGVSGESGFSSNRSTHFSRQGSGSSAGLGVLRRSSVGRARAAGAAATGPPGASHPRHVPVRAVDAPGFRPRARRGVPRGRRPGDAARGGADVLPPARGAEPRGGAARRRREGARVDEFEIRRRRRRGRLRVRGRRSRNRPGGARAEERRSSPGLRRVLVRGDGGVHRLSVTRVGGFRPRRGRAPRGVGVLLPSLGRRRRPPGPGGGAPGSVPDPQRRVQRRASARDPPRRAPRAAEPRVRAPRAQAPPPPAPQRARAQRGVPRQGGIGEAQRRARAELHEARAAVHRAHPENPHGEAPKAGGGRGAPGVEQRRRRDPIEDGIQRDREGGIFRRGRGGGSRAPAPARTPARRIGEHTRRNKTPETPAAGSGSAATR